MKQTAVLLLSCPDQKGLVFHVAEFISRHQGNILHADQHTDTEKGLFLQRVEWELNGFALTRENIAREFEPLAKTFSMRWQLHFSDAMPRVALLASQEAHCVYDLLSRWKMGEFRAEFSLLISNHATLRSVAESFGLPFYHLPISSENKEKQEEKILKILAQEKIDLVVLARYMRIVGPALVEAYWERCINIHHSFLPAFVGAKPYHQAHERGVKIIGATAHYVTRDLDRGPIIEQDVTRVSHRDSVEGLIRKGRDLERVVLARAVGYHLDRRVMVYGQKTVVFD